MTQSLSANETPPEPDATFIKLLETDGAQCVFAALDEEKRRKYERISAMELAAFCAFAHNRLQLKREPGESKSDMDEESNTDKFDSLSDEETYFALGQSVWASSG